MCIVLWIQYIENNLIEARIHKPGMTFFVHIYIFFFLGGVFMEQGLLMLTKVLSHSINMLTGNPHSETIINLSYHSCYFLFD